LGRDVHIRQLIIFGFVNYLSLSANSTGVIRERQST
jgi:hypothetical protein